MKQTFLKSYYQTKTPIEMNSTGVCHNDLNPILENDFGLDGCFNGGSGILFGFSPKRYSERRVKTPQLLLIKLFINETNLFKVLLTNEKAN